MKRCFSFLAVIVSTCVFINSELSASIRHGLPKLKNSPLRLENNKFVVRTTAYTHTESDHLKYGRKNAIGTNLKYGKLRSAAADWSVFPVGTKFRIKGIPNCIYVVDDYGSALVGTGTVDLYKPTKSIMRSWGVRNVIIDVLKWGDYETCYSYLHDRTRHSHVRKMLHNMKRRMEYLEAYRKDEEYDNLF